MPRKTFKEFIPEVTAQLKPMLDTFLKSLGIRRGKEEVGRLQKMEKMGRVTTGFVPEMYREVGEQFGLEETGFRAEHQKGILDRAMELFGLSEQWERQQAQIQSTERIAELNRKLTREGWDFDARQKELDRILTKEGWDWQSRENVLGRVFTAEQSSLDRALSRELTKMSMEGRGGGGGRDRGGISYDFGDLFGGGEVTSKFRAPKPIIDIYGDWSKRRKKPVYKGGRQYSTVEEAMRAPKITRPTRTKYPGGLGVRPGTTYRKKLARPIT